MRKAEALIALVLLCVGGAAFYVAYTSYGEGTETAPMIYSGGLCLLSLLYLAVSLRNGAAPQEAMSSRRRLLCVLGAIAIYMTLIECLGFYCSTWLFLTLFMILSRAATVLKAVVISTFVTAALWLFFDVVLLVPTPRGLIL